MNRSSRHIGILSVFVLVLVMAALNSTGALANQVSQAWFDSHHGQAAVGVVADGNGNIYVAGPDYLDAAGNGSDDMVLIKYGLAGSRKWVRVFDETSDSAIGADVPIWITLDPSGNILVTGRSYLHTAGDTFMTWKYDPNGNLLWKNRNMFGRGVRVATDSLGNVYVTGVNTSSIRTDYVTFKIGPNGNTLWTRIYNGPSDWIDTSMSLAVRPDGRVAVTGNSEGDIVTIVYDTNGNELWRRQFSSKDPSYILTASDVLFGPGGEVYVGGNYLIKYDANGNLLWARPDPATDSYGGAIYRLRIDSSGNIIVIGSFDSAAVVKYAPNGTKLWGKAFTSPNNVAGAPANLTTGSDGAVYVTGTSEGGMLTVKYDANGNVQWQTLFDHTPFDLDSGQGIALDSQGNVVVAGQRPILTVSYLQNGSPAPTPTATSQATPTVVPSQSIHSGDLDGSSAPSGSQYWKATVTFTVHDANEKPVSGVTVSGAWSGGFSSSASCTTGTNGTCSVTTGNIRNTRASATFKISNLARSGYPYSAATNHDPDGDSSGTQITIKKP